MTDKIEEKLSKIKALQMFDTNKINEFDVGTTKGLCMIHECLFSDVYEFAGNVRKENISKGNFCFASALYLDVILSKIDLMPQDSFENIINKYVEMNIAHPFRIFISNGKKSSYSY